MLIAIIGENCVGKSTLAEKINETLRGEIYAGKDYLRLEKNPSAAAESFKGILKAAVTGAHVIYLITEKAHIDLLPDGAFKIILTAPLETIKQRFKVRMRGVLPPPVEKMLESRHGMYDDFPCEVKLDQHYNMEQVLAKLNLA